MGNVDYSGVMLAVGILLALVVLFIGRALVTLHAAKAGWLLARQSSELQMIL